VSTERINDGGPAFPCEESELLVDQSGDAFPMLVPTHRNGMTLRDYFAAKAMHAIVSTMPRVHDRPASELYSIALGSYDYADAMLKAREVKP
jgi:hypothetical protein